MSFEPSIILHIMGKDTLIVGSKKSKSLYWVDLANNNVVEYVPPHVKGKFEIINAAWYHDSTLYILNGNGKSILRKKGFPLPNAAEIIQNIDFSVIKSLPYRDGKIMLRIMENNGPGCRLGIYDVASKNLVLDEWPKDKFNNDCLSTDGGVAFDGVSAFYYVNYYNSRVIRFNSSMSKIYEVQTIDKTKTLPAVRFDSANKSQNFFSPHRIINPFCAADTAALYVLSAVSADNDFASSFRNNTPIDIYAAQTGAYRYSRHLSGININNVKDMKVAFNQLYLVTGKQINIYKP
ncbi:MAG: hypothetical protein JNM68_11340 [Dinghuibacter sp.]|nr:hypothetical protein [Dinghuibacter sp.]